MQSSRKSTAESRPHKETAFDLSKLMGQTVHIELHGGRKGKDADLNIYKYVQWSACSVDMMP
jgi:hypothetical protein